MGSVAVADATADEVAFDNPVRQFQLIYCLWLSVAMVVMGPSHARFYSWFADSGCACPRRIAPYALILRMP